MNETKHRLKQSKRIQKYISGPIPCPFCGSSDLEIDVEGNYGPRAVIRCLVCGCYMSVNIKHTKNNMSLNKTACRQAIFRKWNRRAQS